MDEAGRALIGGPDRAPERMSAPSRLAPPHAPVTGMAPSRYKGAVAQPSRFIVAVSSILRLLAVLLVVGLSMPALAQTTPRAADHDGFGRMVFDWDGPLRWSADVVGDNLVLRFEKPVVGDPKALLKPLSHYLKGAILSADRRMVTFPLAVPVEVKTFTSGTSTVVDIAEAKRAAAPAQAKAPAPAAAPAKAEAPVDVNVRGGEHTGFNRLVFDWPRAVGYKVDLTNGQAVIAFDKPARINPTALEASLPSDVKLAAVRPQGAGLAVVLQVPSEMRLRHFASGNRIAVDLVRPAGAAPPPRPAGVPPPPLAPAPGTADLLPSPPVQPAPSTPAEDLAKKLPAAAEAAAVAQAAKPALAASLGVPFDQPTAAAAFRRGPWLWLVFDRKVEVDTKLLKRSGGEIVKQVEQLEDVRGGTAVRLLTRPGYNPTVRKEGLLWVFDLTQQPLAPRVPLAVDRQFDFEDRGRLVVTVNEASEKAVVFRDPEVGDQIQAIAVMPVNAGVRDPVTLPGVALLASAQGVAMVPRMDGARMNGTRNGVDITVPGGFVMSREVPEKVAGGDERLQRSGGGPLDVSRWARGGLDEFIEQNKKMVLRLTRLKPEDKNAQRLEIARHYLANGMDAEALGLLRVMESSDPSWRDKPEFLAVRGAAFFLMGRDAEATADLSHPSLATDPQAALWLAAAKSRSEDKPQREALMLRLAPEEIKNLTPRLRMALGRAAVVSVATAGDAKAAGRIVESINGPGLSARDAGAIAYMQGLVAEADRNWEQAVAKYQEAEQGESRPDRADAAWRRIELQLKQGTIDAAEATRQFERLRFAWRGGDFEYKLLKHLGELQISAGQYGNGLRTLRSVVENYPDNPDVANVQTMMNQAFESLFLNGGADKLSPVVAIGLYDEFQELTPSGDKGDEMIRKLADRLASVDLLDRASDLLSHQVQFRLQGVDKARIGARAALLELSNRKPAQAIETLDRSEVQDQPGELYDQRRYLRVRALADLGRAAEALALIINDHSPTAKQLRAEIYWDMKRWPDAATALDDMLQDAQVAGDPKRVLPPQTQRRILDLATALTLSRDDRGLARIRRLYGPQMDKTNFREAFELLTSEPERGIVDYRRVGEKIKQVEDFQTFLGEWRKRVQAQGVSSIN